MRQPLPTLSLAYGAALFILRNLILALAISGPGLAAE